MFLYIIHRLDFIVDRDGVLTEVRTKFMYIIYTNSGLHIFMPCKSEGYPRNNAQSSWLQRTKSASSACASHIIGNKKKVKWSRYRPGVAQKVGRGIALLFHDRGTRRGWVVSSTPRPRFTPGKDPVPILQEAGWAPGPVWMGGKSRPHRDSMPDGPARSESLYRPSYPAHI